MSVRPRYSIILANAALVLSACTIPDKPPQEYLSAKKIPPPSASAYTICHGYGCQFRSNITPDNAQWARITKPMAKPAPNAEAERAQIADVIGRFERWSGALTGTDKDVAGTFRQAGHYQLDCVDESTNTTTYLLALEKAGYLHFHRVKSPTARLPLIHAGHWPHQSAVIEETATHEFYVVDSWFRDNGAPADIISLKTWKDGWRPKNIDDSWL